MFGAELTEEGRRSIDEMHTRLLGYLRFGDTKRRTEDDDELLVPGLLVPSWFNPRGTTLSDVNRTTMRR